MTNIFVSWTRQNGRTADLAATLGLEAHYVYLPSKLGLPGRYARQLRATRQLLASTRPQSVALMLPPAPALLAFLGLGTRRPARIAFDLHTGFFLDPKWAWALQPSLRLMRRLGGTAIVTGTHLKGVCEAAGVPAVVLHDALFSDAQAGAPGNYLLCPLSYANDEPVLEILAAARATPEVEWRLTGRAPAAVVAAAPANVTFTGFVSELEYDALLRGSLGVVALTTRAHTMQRAGYEAFGAGVPQITSDFEELREFYGSSAVFATPHAASIVAAVHELREHRAKLIADLERIRIQRVEEQQQALAAVRTALGIRASSGAAATGGDE